MPDGGRPAGLLARARACTTTSARSPPCSACREEPVEVELVANGGAFGGKEDLSVQAQRRSRRGSLGRPVQLALTRERVAAGCTPSATPSTMRLHGRLRRRGPAHRRARAHRRRHRRLRLGRRQGARAGRRPLLRPLPGAGGRRRGAAPSTPTTRPAARCAASASTRPRSPSRACSTGSPTRVGIDRWEIRERNVLRPGDRFATGQVMDASCGIARHPRGGAGRLQAAPAAPGSPAASRTPASATASPTSAGCCCAVLGRRPARGAHRLHRDGPGAASPSCARWSPTRPASTRRCMDVGARSELAVECGMTTASRATALPTMAAQRAAAEARRRPRRRRRRALAELAGRELPRRVHLRLHGRRRAPRSTTRSPTSPSATRPRW